MNLIAHTTMEVLLGNGVTVTEIRANKAHAPRLCLIDTVNGKPISSIVKVNEYIHVGHGWVNVYHINRVTL